jgi:restriction system protein
MPPRNSTSAGPQFTRYLGPVLKALRDLGGSGRPREVESVIVSELKIPEAEQNEVTKSGQSRFRNQVAWAKFYLSKAGYVESSAHGVWALTPKGNATILDGKAALELFAAVQEPWSRSKVGLAPMADDGAEELPEEAALSNSSNYRTDLLTLLRTLPASGFERLCQRLLRVSGFQEVKVTGKTGDGGIDGHGVLQINPLVSFRVLFQCKRYSGAVVPAQVRDFRGAMAGRADKGIIITTGTFTAEARKEAGRDGVPSIELVDGEKLIDMFEEHKLGLIPKQVYDIDESFFDEFK